MLTKEFFNRDAITVAKDLLGKVLRVKYKRQWLSAMIIETEAYYLHDKGSHASLGWTQKRHALFMEPGTIYMYYARGGDSLNMSCDGEGDAVLIKSGIPYQPSAKAIEIMHQLNPIKNTSRRRKEDKLCSGQTLLCRALGLKVPQWDQKPFDRNKFYIEDIHYNPQKIIQAKRLGIPAGRDEHLLYRFIDYAYASSATSNPLTKRNFIKGKDYRLEVKTAKSTG